MFDRKINIIDNKITIFNYKEIVKISENMIETKDYYIDIDNLKLKSMDGYLLILEGRIKRITIL